MTTTPDPVDLDTPAADSPPTMVREDAEKLDKRIREAEFNCAKNMAGEIAALAALIEEARAAKIHAALGYPTFAAYRRATRRDRVRSLAEQGVSNRTIAAVAGVTEGTVRNDLKRGAQNYAPEQGKRRGSVGKAISDLKKATDRVAKLAADDKHRAELADSIDKLADYRDALEAVIGKLEAQGQARLAQTPMAR